MYRCRTGKSLFLFLLFIALLSEFLFAGEKAETGQIIIGCLQDLTDPASDWGTALKRGAELAVEKINAAGGLDGKSLELKTYDIKNDPMESLNLYIRLVDQDKAVAVIGPPLGTAGLALANLSAAKRVPVLVGFPDARALGKEGREPPALYVPRSARTEGRIAELLADFAPFKAWSEGYRCFIRPNERSCNDASQSLYRVLGKERRQAQGGASI